MTLNRAQRRDLKRKMANHGTAFVVLRGGPMDGWVVKPNAPALQPDWQAKHIESVTQESYAKVRTEFLRKRGAREMFPPWDELDDERREHFRGVTQKTHEPGRYVLRPDGRDADWVAE